MTPEDQEIMRLTVRGAVQDGVQEAVEPIWSEIRVMGQDVRETKIDCASGKTAQFEQGKRLGMVEREIAVLGVHRAAVVAIALAILGIASKVVYDWISK